MFRNMINSFNEIIADKDSIIKYIKEQGCNEAKRVLDIRYIAYFSNQDATRSSNYQKVRISEN